MDDNDITIWNCPEKGCNGKLIKRKNKRTGLSFLGCTNFPRCRYTQRDETMDKDDLLGDKD
jgi:ssDNA-binding Zn-finger/Zn-ribbon topoisomerase 1